MEENIIHYRHILLYYFKKCKRAAEAAVFMGTMP
ncbi:unnamed protein product [Nezara viridula]|uniref:Uncharacterized protein n=1 Tax=Nezara viridula TaxID=85310 RepID=A0A9P0HFT1_NEZVI|nr:unnamed protein product [Nezara viridula]